jgi:hypothetical protein
MTFETFHIFLAFIYLFISFQGNACLTTPTQFLHNSHSHVCGTHMHGTHTHVSEGCVKVGWGCECIISLHSILSLNIGLNLRPSILVIKAFVTF